MRFWNVDLLHIYGTDAFLKYAFGNFIHTSRHSVALIKTIIKLLK